MIENEIITYLTKYTTLSDELADILVKSTIVKQLKKGTVLLKEGDISSESYLVLKGCIRSYILNDGDEKTLEFYTEEQPILPISYGKGSPSEEYLECIEDSIIVVSTPEHETAMLQKYPQFESICRIMTEVMMANFQESFVNYKMASAEERYLYLLKNRSDLIQRVPQYQLASYLGLKPESLSRMKKRLSKK